MYRKQLIQFAGLIFLIVLIAIFSDTSHSAPTVDPENVIHLVTDFELKSPRINYAFSHGWVDCTDDDEVTDYIGRTAIQGVVPRHLYEFSYDCGSRGPNIMSNVAGDENHVYWVNFDDGGLVRLPVDSMLGAEPELVSSYDYDVDPAEILVAASHVYILEKGYSGEGIFRVDKLTGSSTRLLDASLTGTAPFDFKSDGYYLYWRSLSGSDDSLKRYDLSGGTYRTIVNGVTSYAIDPALPGLGIYVAMPDELRVYLNFSETLEEPFYTSDIPVEITSITVDSENVYFIEMPNSGLFTIKRLPHGTREPIIMHTSPSTPAFEALDELQVHEDYLYFLHFLSEVNIELVRLPTDADSITLTNLRITGMEVTQAIQSDTQSVPLIQGKRTAVRLFVQSDGEDVPGVTAHLYRLDETGAVMDDPLQPNNRLFSGESPYLRVISAPDPDNVHESFLFFLPPDWVDGDTLRLRADLNPFHFPHEPAYEDNLYTSETFDMLPSPRLETEIVLFSYEVCDAADVCTIHTPRYREDYLQAVSWIRRAYPLASNPGSGDDSTPGFRPNVRTLFDSGLDDRVLQLADCSTVYPDPDNRNKCASHYTNTILSTLRIAEELPDSVFMYGMISDGAGFFPRGQASGRVSSGPAGIGGGWDTDGSYADWYMGHEIGHSLGRRHPIQNADDPSTPNVKENCGHSPDDILYPYENALIGDGSYRGFDVGNLGLNPLLVPRVYPDETWHDFMTYCPYQWISNYTSEGIYNYISAHDALSSSQNYLSNAVQTGPYLQLNGMIDAETNRTTMLQVRHWPSLENISDQSLHGSHQVRLKDASGSILATHDFTPLPIADSEGSLSIDLLVPFVSGTRRIEIWLNASETLLWQYQISPNAPTVKNVQVFDTSDPITGNATLQWTANDADGDPLTFDVLYSVDDGATWKMFRMGATDQQITINTSLLAGSLHGRFKVLAHDGANQGEGISPAVSIANKAPIVTILSPADETRIAYGQTLLFEVDVLDLQDGSVLQKNITWRGQDDRLLGSGNTLSTSDLMIGTNEITVRAQNSAGLWREKSVTVYVDDNLELPGPSLAVAPSQIGWYVPAETTTLQTATVSVTNVGDGTLTVSVEEDADWLSIYTSASTTPMTVTLTADSSNLNPGESLITYVEIIGTANSEFQQIDVPVSISVFNSNQEEKYMIYLPLIMQ